MDRRSLLKMFGLASAAGVAAPLNALPGPQYHTLTTAELPSHGYGLGRELIDAQAEINRRRSVELMRGYVRMNGRTIGEQTWDDARADLDCEELFEHCWQERDA